MKIADLLQPLSGKLVSDGQTREPGRAMSGLAKSFALTLSFAGLLVGATNANAAACNSLAAGNWGTAGTWSCGHVPLAADDVTVATGHTVTVNVATANVLSVTVNTGAILTQTQALSTAGALGVAGTLTSNNAMTVTGATTVTGNLNIVGAGVRTFTGLVAVTGGTWNNSGNRAVTFRGGITNNGTFTAGTGTQTFNLTQAIGGTNPINFGGIVAVAGAITVTNNNTNTVTVAGNLTGSVAGSTWMNAANSTLNYGGALAPLATGVLNASTVPNTVNYNGGAAQAIKTANYNNLTVTKAAGIAATTAAGTVNVTGVLTVTSGTLNIAGTTIAVTGATNVSGTLGITSTTGTKTFTGLVTVYAGGVWSNTLNEAVTFRGGITHNGAAFTSGTGTQTFDTNSQAIGGASPLSFGGIVAVVGAVTVTNSNTNTVTIAGNLTGSVAGSTWMNAANSTLNYGGALAPMATGVLTASAVPNTVNYNRAGAQTVKSPSAGYYHLTLSGSGVKTMPPPIPSGLIVGGNFSMTGTASVTAAGAINVTGNFSLGAGTSFTAGIYGHQLKGNFSNSGTFVPSTGTFVFNGSTLQTLTGVTTFSNWLVNNNAGLSLASNITLSSTLTLNNGNIATNANTLITTANCANTVTRFSGHIVGNLRKRIPPGASTCTFEVGSGISYTPIVAVFAAGTTTGVITASTTGAEHPSIASSGIDPAKSVNRYWTLTNGGVALPAAGFSATFNFINGSPVDFDAGAIPANFIAQRWNGAAWVTQTLNATCTATPATNLCKQVNGIAAAGFGDFAIGEPVSVVVTPGSFNAFEASTAAGAITGRIFTKLAGVVPSLDIVAISGGAQMNTFTNSVIVELLGNQTAGVPLDAQNCPTSFTLIQTATPNPAITGGRSTVNFAAVTNAWKDVRVRVRFPVASPAVVSCSTDNFAIRPAGFTVSSTNANNTGTTGTPAIKTGMGFNLSAASIAGYNGTPAIDNAPGMVAGTPVQGAIGGAFATALAATGTATGNAFFYSEAGNFGLSANAVFDDTFTSVDQPGDCTADFSNVLAGGQYGCKFGNAAVPLVIGSSGFGRFTPDNFNVGYNTPVFGAACGTFGYVGQTFSFITAPVMTVVARQGAANGLTNATTANYAGAYMKLTNASLGQAPFDTAAGRYSRFDALGGGATPALDTGGLPPPASDPAIGTFTNGVGTLTFGTGAGLLFTRSIAAPSAPFNADIALAINVVDADGVTFAGNPAAFGSATPGGGIAFSGGKELRFGRLRLSNAHGSELLNLPVPIQAQYWNGAAFVTNTADNCTTLAANNIRLTAPPAGVSTTTGGAFSGGAGLLILTKPATPAKVSVDLCVDLGVDPVGGTTCAATSSANLPYLQGRWPPGASYNNDPAARATFGVYKGSNEFIYLRENY